MNYRVMMRLTALTMLILGLFMIPALLISLFRAEYAAVQGFGLSMLVCLILGAPFFFLRRIKAAVRAREGYITVALCWILVSVTGALPLFFSRAVPRFVDCLFEAVSGFTTTGASVLIDLDSLPKGLIYWRAFSHWLGGMGVLVFLLILVPTSAGAGDNVFLMRAESPGPQVSKLMPKTRDTARILYLIYIGMTMLEAALLMCGGLTLFDSVTISMATAGTGGFSITNAGMGLYSSYVRWVVTVFMTLFGVNFGVYYLILQRTPRKILRNDEFKVYISAVILATGILTVKNLPFYEHSFNDSLRESAFQVASIVSTTGFATSNFDAWPLACKVVLFLLMFIGASAGSTAGGVKVSRCILVFKSIRLSMRRLLHPKTVSRVRMDGEAVSENTLHFVYIFFGAYFFIAGVSLFLLSFDRMDFESTVSGLLACLNNVGPGFGAVGPYGSYVHLSAFSKLVLCADMLIGRLEIFPMLLLVMPGNWKKLHN